MGGKYSSPFLGLTLIFVMLKLLRIISWSWVWVLSPIWISVLVAIILYVVTEIALRYIAGNERCSCTHCPAAKSCKLYDPESKYGKDYSSICNVENNYMRRL